MIMLLLALSKNRGRWVQISQPATVMKELIQHSKSPAYSYLGLLVRRFRGRKSFYMKSSRLAKGEK